MVVPITSDYILNPRTPTRPDTTRYSTLDPYPYSDRWWLRRNVYTPMFSDLWLMDDEAEATDADQNLSSYSPGDYTSNFDTNPGIPYGLTGFGGVPGPSPYKTAASVAPGGGFDLTSSMQIYSLMVGGFGGPEEGFLSLWFQTGVSAPEMDLFHFWGAVGYGIWRMDFRLMLGGPGAAPGQLQFFYSVADLFWVPYLNVKTPGTNYNDGNWHQVIIRAANGPDGTYGVAGRTWTIYMDGYPVAGPVPWSEYSDSYTPAWMYLIPAHIYDFDLSTAPNEVSYNAFSGNIANFGIAYSYFSDQEALELYHAGIAPIQYPPKTSDYLFVPKLLSSPDPGIGADKVYDFSSAAFTADPATFGVSFDFHTGGGLHDSISNVAATGGATLLPFDPGDPTVVKAYIDLPITHHVANNGELVWLYKVNTGVVTCTAPDLPTNFYLRAFLTTSWQSLPGFPYGATGLGNLDIVQATADMYRAGVPVGVHPLIIPSGSPAPNSFVPSGPNTDYQALFVPDIVVQNIYWAPTDLRLRLFLTVYVDPENFSSGSFLPFGDYVGNSLSISGLSVSEEVITNNRPTLSIPRTSLYIP